MSDSSSGPRVVHVDLDKCVGHGKCYLVAPDLMEPFDDEGRAEFVGEPVQDGDSRLIAQGEEAIDACPEQALSWRPADGQ